MAKPKGKETRDHGVEYIFRPDSVEVTKNAKDEYSHKIKVYFDSEGGKDTKAHTKAVDEVKKIDALLRKTFKSPK